MHPLEISANCIMLISVLLARKNNIHSWWLGIIGCGLFCILFFQIKLYADMMLQIFFIMTCIYGWWNWSRGGSNYESLPITTLSKIKLLQYLGLSILISAIHGFLLETLTDASSPFMDSALLILSIFAQFLLTARKYETWIIWIIVNLISVPLYFTQGLILTAFLYLVFLFNSIWGFTTWKRILKSPETCANPI